VALLQVLEDHRRVVEGQLAVEEHRHLPARIRGEERRGLCEDRVPADRKLVVLEAEPLLAQRDPHLGRVGRGVGDELHGVPPGAFVVD
jgi:hypothetical protein